MFSAQALNMREDRLSKAVVLNGGIGNDFAPQRAAGQVWRHLGLSQVGESCYWHLVDRIQGCYKTPYNAQESPPQQELSLNDLSVVLRLRNSALTKLRLAGSIKFSGNTELKCCRLRKYILKRNKVYLDAIILPIESHPVVERILKKLAYVKLQSQAICTVDVPAHYVSAKPRYPQKITEVIFSEFYNSYLFGDLPCSLRLVWKRLIGLLINISGPQH